MKLNYTQLNYIGVVSKRSGGGAPVDPGYTDYELEAQSLFLAVNTTTVTLKDGKTAAVASNDHIKIVDEDMKHYTLKEWNDRSVANGFDNSLVAKPIGFSLECNGVRTIVRWQWTGKYLSLIHISEPTRP